MTNTKQSNAPKFEIVKADPKTARIGATGLMYNKA